MADLPKGFFPSLSSVSVSKEEQEGERGEGNPLPENFFPSLDTIEMVNDSVTVEPQGDTDIPTDPTLLPEHPDAPAPHKAPVLGIDYSGGDIIAEEARRFADSYGPTRELQNWVGDIASIRGASEGLKVGEKLAQSVSHPLGKTAIITGASALGVGLHQFVGEIMEQELKGGNQIDYSLAYEEAKQSAQWDAGGNLVLKGFGVVSRKALSKSGISVDDATVAAQKLFEKYGTTLTRYQLTGTFWAKAAETLSTLGLDLASSVKKVSAKQHDALSKEMDRLLSTDHYADVGERISAVHGEALQNISAEYGRVLSVITQNAPNVKLNMKSFQALVEKNIRQSAGIQTVAEASGGDGMINKINAMLSSTRTKASFEEVGRTISNLSELQREAKKAGNRNAARYAGEMRDELENTMARASSQLGSNYKREYDTLRSWYDDSVNKLNSEVMFKAMQKEPSAVGKYLVHSPEAVKHFKGFLSEAAKRGVITAKEMPELMNNVRKGYLSDLIKEEATFGEILQVGKQLRKKRNRELAQEVLGPPMMKRLEDILSAADLIKANVDHNARFGLVMAGKTSTAITTLVGKATAIGGMSAAAPVIGMNIPTALGLLSAPTILGKIAADGSKTRVWKNHVKLLKRAQETQDAKVTKLAITRAVDFISQTLKTQDSNAAQVAITRGADFRSQMLSKEEDETQRVPVRGVAN